MHLLKLWYEIDQPSISLPQNIIQEEAMDQTDAETVQIQQFPVQ